MTQVCFEGSFHMPRVNVQHDREIGVSHNVSIGDSIASTSTGVLPCHWWSGSDGGMVEKNHELADYDVLRSATAHTGSGFGFRSHKSRLVERIGSPFAHIVPQTLQYQRHLAEQ